MIKICENCKNPMKEDNDGSHACTMCGNIY